jgi:periplasmic protein TonB
MLLRIRTFLKQLSTLQIAIGVSLLVHALLIMVRFVDPEGFNRVFKDTPLEVILVNAKSSDKLDDLQAKAQAIAQFKLAGGGDADKGLASSPLPSSNLTDIGLAADQAQAQVEQLQAQQMRMLVDIKDQMANLPKPDPKLVKSSERAEQERKRQQLLKLLAAIERRINEENARPKKRYISPATRQEAYALYYDDLRRKIEQRGTQNFPESMGRKLYGELTLLITVNHDGRVLDLEVVTSSGDKLLDSRAKAIAKQAEPFGTFTSTMRRTADQLVVVSRFKFTRDAQLETSLAAQ